jgi:hypothetical protein
LQHYLYGGCAGGLERVQRKTAPQLVIINW